MGRVVELKTYNRSVQLRQVTPGLYRSESGRVHVLGEGTVGGKGAGTLLLDQVKTENAITGYEVPRSLILCDDFLGPPDQSLAAPVSFRKLLPQKIAGLASLLKELDFSTALALRSSSIMEDRPWFTGAGMFKTDFHARPLDAFWSKRQLAAKLAGVYASAFAPKVEAYWRRHEGIEIIPLLPLIIQEVVGNNWQYAPRYFLPALAGIVNTAARKNVKVASVLGLGLSAVGQDALGVLHKLPISDDGRSVLPTLKGQRGLLNDTDLYCLDRKTGKVVRLQDKRAIDLFPFEYLKRLEHDLLAVPYRLADMALAFQRLLGFPIDLEWAWGGEAGQGLNLVQLRPLKPRPEIAKPAVDQADLIFKSDAVVGYGEKTFRHVIFVDDAYGNIPDGEFRHFILKYPDSLLVYKTGAINRHTNELVTETLMPNARALIVEEVDHRQRIGTGLHHFALELADLNHILVYSDQPIVGKLKNRGVEVETAGDPRDRSAASFSVYEFSRPLKLSADDDADWALAYLGR